MRSHYSYISASDPTWKNGTRLYEAGSSEDEFDEQHTIEIWSLAPLNARLSPSVLTFWVISSIAILLCRPLARSVKTATILYVQAVIDPTRLQPIPSSEKGITGRQRWLISNQCTSPADDTMFKCWRAMLVSCDSMGPVCKVSKYFMRTRLGYTH